MAKVRVEELHDGALWKVVLDAPKANIVDTEMLLELNKVFNKAELNRHLKAVLLEGEGDHFSFGASIEEHLPGPVKDMLGGFHALFRQMSESGVPCLAAVRGQCLGGGLELAAFCHRVFASPDAKLGQPEIQLAVIAPVASIILPERMGRGPAEDLCISGRIIGAEEAYRTGLVDEIADDPTAAATGYFEKYLLKHSGSSLRYAVRAVRQHLHRRLRDDLDDVEAIYLKKLMKTHDAVEGIQAFLEKRKPVWKNA